MRHTVDTLQHQFTSVYLKPYSYNAAKPLDEQREAIREKNRQLVKMPPMTLRAK